MELILADHPADCTECPKYLNCELQSLKQYLGISEELRIKRHPKLTLVNSHNPLFLHDFSRCILCGRCVRACYELRGVGVLSYIDRGSRIHIGTAFNRSLADAGCRFCGACVEVCPTGSLRDHAALLEKASNRRAALIPCKYTCPAEIDVPRYIRFISEKNYHSAVAVIREKVPFPKVLGYVCDHPCEVVCRRSQINEAISIKELKRFAAEMDISLWTNNLKKTVPTGKRVAVIGSGPAGLTAAYYLTKLGYNVTVFEALPLIGGMMRVGIPEYRLPRNVLDGEIRVIENVGVEIKTNTKINSLDWLFDEGYKAILVAIGTHRGQKLSIHGNDMEGVVTGLSFLKNINMGKEVRVGKRVVVIGGGNVAIDCARTARRLGATDVVVACLEPEEGMLATTEEIIQSREEGITIHNLRNFTRILGENGRVSGVECCNINSFEFDEEGNLKVESVPDSTHVLDADTVIFAIGQCPDIPEQFGLNISRSGIIKIDEHTHTTNREGVFAAGDAISGTSSVSKAIVSGRKMAGVIDNYLGGTGIIDETLEPVGNHRTWLGQDSTFARQRRSELSYLPVAERLCSFNKIVSDCDEEMMLKESQRCLQCDLRFRISSVKFWADYSAH